MRQPIKKEILETEYYKNNPYLLNKEEDEYILLVDGHTLLKTSMVDKTPNSRGEVIGAIFQFLLKIKLMMEKRNFKHVYVLWDGDNSGSIRWEIYPNYKKNRFKQYSDYDRKINAFVKNVLSHKQKTKKEEEDYEKKLKEKIEFTRLRLLLHDILEDLFVRQVIDNLDGTECDDLIAYFCLNKRDNQKVFIMTTDSDLHQLISDTVMIYEFKKKEYYHKGNYKEKFGIPVENVLLKKILIGDGTDKINGVYWLGNDNIFTYFPEITERPVTLDEILEHAKQIQEEHTKPKISEKTGKQLKGKPPIKVINNVIHGISKDKRENLYEINEKLINLKKPLIGRQVQEEMDEIMNNPLSIDDRNIENVYKIIMDNEINQLKGNSFANFFLPFKKLANREKEFYKTTF